MEVLIGIVFVVIIWAVLGHGIWLIGAVILRALFGSNVVEARPVNLRLQCQFCGATLSPADRFCLQCGQPQGQPPNSELVEFNAAARQFERWQQAGRLDAETAQALQRVIEAERLRLSGTPATTVPSHVPETQAPAHLHAPAPPVAAPAAHEAPASVVVPQSPVRAPQLPASAANVPPPAPQHSFGEMLTAFLEESSIRWGELIGGLLIIGCSLALVISLWSEIAERPVLKFGIFMTLIAGLFGLGFYSAHRWKLPTTSRGVLLTAIILVPLNFLAVTAFGRTEASGAGIVIAEVLAWLCFSALVWLAARIVAPLQQRWLTSGVMVAALALLLGKHLAPLGLNWHSWLWFGCLPLLGYLASTGLALRQAQQTEEPDEPLVYGLFTVLGVSLFATALPLGLLLLRAGVGVHALRANAPLFALLGVPALALGWLLWRRLGAATWASERTAAISLGLCGAGVLLGSALLAFPAVNSLLAVALLNLLIWGGAAWRYEKRAVRWLAWLQAVWTFLLVAHLAAGRLVLGEENAQHLLAVLFSNASGWLLAVAFAAFIGLAEWRNRYAETSTDSPDALLRDSDLAALLTALASLVLVTLHGFGVAGDPRHLSWLYAFYALIALVLAWRRSVPLLTAGALLLWLGVCVQSCVYQYGWPQGWAHAGLVSWLVFAASASLLALGSVWLGERAQLVLIQPAIRAAWLSAAGTGLVMLTRLDGLSGWYVAPLIFVAVTGALSAWRTGWALTAWASGLLFNLVVTLGYLIWLQPPAGFLNSGELARLLQLNLLTAAVYALAWLKLAGRQGLKITAASWMGLQLHALIGLGLVVLSWTALRLIAQPYTVSQFAQRLGDGLGWLTLLLLSVGLVTLRAAKSSEQAGKRLSLSHWVGGYLAAGVLLAATSQHFETGNWLSYHALLALLVVGAWALLWIIYLASRLESVETSPLTRWVVGTNPSKLARIATLWSAVLAGGGIWLALRGYAAPGGPWRSVLALAAFSALSVGLALVRQNGAYFYAAGALACVALTEWLYGYSRGDGTLLDVVLLNATALACVALLSLVLELRFLQTAKPPAVPAFHQFALGLLLILTCLKVGAGLEMDFIGALPLVNQSWIGGLALAAVGSLCVACLWDARFKYRFFALYVIGLAGWGAWVDRQNWPAERLLVVGAGSLSAYALLMALLWRKRAAVQSLLLPMRVPQLDWRGAAGLWWLSRLNALLAVGALVAATLTSLTESHLSWRLSAASVLFLAPWAVGLVAEGVTRLRRQTLAVALGLAVAVNWSWAWVHHAAPQRLLERLVLLLAWTLGGALLFFILEAAQRTNWVWLGAWERATRRVMRAAGWLGLGVLGLVLFVEWLVLGLVGTEPVPGWTKAVVTVLLLVLGAAQIGFALWQGRDPLGWAAAKRGRYIYAAELCAVLLLAHLRLTAPWLFGGHFKAYWPLLVLALAFIGVGVSEQLRRRGRVVLAEPLSRTGVFLPLLPSLGFWLAESRVDYAGVLLAVGLFYGLLSVLRQSFGFGLLAALAANGGLWHWLQRTDDYGFLVHPQLWLIPAALSVMLAAHLNRAQLSAEQMTTIRYTALMAIYVSSTADIFINGVGRSPWLPLVLALLSVAGVLLGIALRVRAYLFLGTAFLLLAVLTMVWHAALSLGWGWLWYVVGIGFGVFILYLFALFERKRAEVLGLVERLKSWQA